METNFDVFDKNGSGVYMIKNVLNNHKYIGSTKNFKQRLKQHISDLHNNKHHSSYLQAAWNKYGEKHFVFQILETCEPIKDTLYKKVIQKDKNGNIVNIYNSTTEAADFLLEHELMNKNRKIVSCAISACARGVNKTAYKYIWEYGN